MSEIAYKLPVIETIKSSWQQVKGAKAAFFSAFMCFFIIEFTRGFIEGLRSEAVIPNNALVTIIMICLMLIGSFLQCGIIYMGVKRALGLPVHFAMIKSISLGIFLRVLGFGFLSLCVLLPALALIILASWQGTEIGLAPPAPGSLRGVTELVIAIFYMIGYLLYIYLSTRLSLGLACVIADKINPWRAIKLSFKATKSNVCRLLALFFISALIVVLSLIPLGIGLIWSIPYAYTAYGMVYKNLVSARSLILT